MNINQEDDRKLQESLQRSVAHALEQKRRLGQYAVVWRDGKPVRLEPETTRYRVQEADDPVAYRRGDGRNPTKQDKP